MGLVRDLMELPSGKRLHNYGKSACLTGKLTISMAMFNSYLKLPQGIQKSNLQPANRYFVISTTALVWVTQKKSWGVLPFCDTSEIWSSWMGNCREYPTCLPKSVILRSENVFFSCDWRPIQRLVPHPQYTGAPSLFKKMAAGQMCRGLVNGHFRNWLIGCTYHVYGLCTAYVREYPHKLWSYMVLYLHFRIMKFLLIWCMSWPIRFGENLDAAPPSCKSCHFHAPCALPRTDQSPSVRPWAIQAGVEQGFWWVFVGLSNKVYTVYMHNMCRYIDI